MQLKEAGVPEELLSNTAVASKADLAALVKDHVNLQALIGRKGVTLPAKTAAEDPTAWNDVFKALGRPDAPSDYKLAASGADRPEIVSEAAESWARDTIHAAGLNSWQAAVVWDRLVGFLQTADKTIGEQTAAAAAAAEAALRTEQGAAYDGWRKDIKLLISDIGGAGMEDKLAAAGVMGNPDVLRFFGGVAAKMKEDGLIGATQIETVLSPGAAEDQLAALRNNPDFRRAFTDPKHPRHGEYRERHATLQKWASAAGKQAEPGVAVAVSI